MNTFLGLIDDINPDIVHSWLPHANIFCKLCRARKEVRLVTSIRAKEIRPINHHAFERLTDFLSDRTIVNSYVLKNYLKKSFRYKDSKVEVIYNGVESSKPNLKGGRDKSLGITGKKNITMVANFRKQKDYPTAVRTAKELLKYRDDFCFRLVGNGGEKEKIENMVKELGLEKHIKFLSERKDVPEILSQSDVFLLTSLYEGQSNSIIESMFYGCPIVATDIEENLEIIQDGEDGLLFGVKKSEEAAKAIDRILSDKKLAAKLRKNASEKAKKLFSTKNMVKRYCKMYEELLSGSGKT